MGLAIHLSMVRRISGLAEPLTEEYAATWRLLVGRDTRLSHVNHYKRRARAV